MGTFLKSVPFEYSESHGVQGVLTGTAKFPSCEDCSSADRGLKSTKSVLNIFCRTYWAFSSCKRRDGAGAGGAF